MAIVNVTGISGINSITAQSTSLNFYDSTGNTLSIGASVSGNITGNVTGNVSGNVTGAINSTGVSTFSGGVVVAAGTTAAPSISPTGDSNTGIFFPAADTVAFAEGGVEALRITSSGTVGVNTTAVDSQLEVHSAASKINTVTIKTSAGASGYAGLAFMAGQTSAGREKAAIYFQETNGGAHYTGDIVFALNSTSGSAVQVSTSDERFRITSSGNLGIGTNNPTKALHISQNSDVAIRMHSGNCNTNARSWEIVVGGNASNNAEMVFRTRNDAGTGGSEAARFTTSGNLAFPSGQGIDFSATANSSGTMTSELLSDYEEGTWTPAYSFAGGGSVTYQSQVAVYTKIGRVVYISGRIAVTTISSPSGQIFVRGLPFTPATYSQRINGVTIHRAGSWNTAPIAGTIFETNSGEIEFYKASTTANNTTDLLGSDLAGNCFVSFFGQYEV